MIGKTTGNAAKYCTVLEFAMKKWYDKITKKG